MVVGNPGERGAHEVYSQRHCHYPKSRLCGAEVSKIVTYGMQVTSLEQNEVSQEGCKVSNAA